MRSSTWMDVNGVVLIGVTLPLMNISEKPIISSSSAVSHGVSHGSLGSTGERGCAQCKEANGGRDKVTRTNHFLAGCKLVRRVPRRLGAGRSS